MAASGSRKAIFAALAGNALVKAGVPDIAAHLFVMYFGMLSMVTPPVAVAAFAAANLAEANPWQTSWAAAKLAWSAYLVPFLFIASPSLLFIGTIGEVIWASVTAMIGVFAATVGIVGYLRDHLALWTRIALFVAGIAVLTPAGAYDGAFYGELVGLALIAGLVAMHPGRPATRCFVQQAAKIDLFGCHDHPTGAVPRAGRLARRRKRKCLVPRLYGQFLAIRAVSLGDHFARESANFGILVILTWGNRGRC